MPVPSSRRYKDFKIYCCFALNRLVQAYDIDLYQSELEEKLDGILESNQDVVVTKRDIRHEIRSNHTMTNKVLKELEGNGHIEIEKQEDRYNIRLTRSGALHVRRFNEYYFQLYKSQIRDHYKYVGLPSWARHLGDD